VAIRGLIFGLFVPGAVFADPPPGYYDTAEGKTGAALRLALHQIIDDHAPLSYGGGATQTRGAIESLDESPNDPGSVRLVYSGFNVLKSTFGSGDGHWDQEHLWPRPFGTAAGAPLSDVHHLRPCDSTVNDSRGNLLFDESDPNATGYRVPAHDEAPGTSRDGNSWEPREVEKGDIARAMLYMDVRYEGDAGEPDLRLTDDLGSIVSGNTNMGRLTTLLEWHLLDPPDDAERTRNDGVYSYQVNRNPFVDRPEWVTEVFGHPLRLTMSMHGETLQLRWPSGLRRAVLEQSSDLAGWIQITATPGGSGNEYVLTLPATEGRKFYRLSVR
jgi:endonuclease I